MFVFGLCSISDDWPSDLSDEHQPKCEKKALKSSTNEMVVGLAGVILLVISRAPAYYIRLI